VIALGQVCDQRLRAEAQGGIGYSLREPDVRCEGLYESSVRAPGLEVVSLLYERPRFDLEQHDRILVVAPDISGFVADPVKVRAVALPLKTYYRMDAVMPERGPLIWPVKDVLGPAGFATEQIGVFGWVGDEVDKLFVPLWVLPADHVPVGDGEQSGVQTASPELLVRLANDAETVLWRYQENEKTSEWAIVGGGTVSAGRTVRLLLPPGPAGQLQIDVVAKRPDSDDWSTLRLDVVRPGP
jgi:hypothetical protein